MAGSSGLFELGRARAAGGRRLAAEVVGSSPVLRDAVVVEPDGESRLLVQFEGASPVSVPALAGKYPSGGTVAVLVDSNGRPQRVVGAVSDEQAETGAGEYVTVLPSLVPDMELSEEERARLASVESGLADAKTLFDERMTGVESGLASAEAEIESASQASADYFAELGSLLDSVQQTADQSVLDARDAHDAAVAAQEVANSAIALARNSENLLAPHEFIADWSYSSTHWDVTQTTATARDSGSTSQVFTRNFLTDLVPGNWYESSYIVTGADSDSGFRLQMGEYKDGAWRRTLTEVVTVPARAVSTVRARFQISADLDVNGWRVIFRTDTPSDFGVTVEAPRLVDVTDAVRAGEVASEAQARADDAYQLAESKLSASEVETRIEASANGKNTITVSTVQWSAGSPGVVAGDLWRWVNTEGDLIGEATWDGTMWKPSLIRSEAISHVDVHILTVTGDAKIAEAVINKLFAEVVVAEIIRTQEAFIGGNAIVDGAITARNITVTDELVTKLLSAEEAWIGAITANMMNFVPEAGVGGMALDAKGLDIIAADGSTSMSIRSDKEQFISLSDQDGNIGFSASASGDVGVGNVLSAGADVTIAGASVLGMFDAQPAGVVERVELAENIKFGSAWGTLFTTNFEAKPNRTYRATLRAGVMYDGAEVQFMRAASGVAADAGPTDSFVMPPVNSKSRSTATFVHEWVTDDTVADTYLLRVRARSTLTNSVNFLGYQNTSTGTNHYIPKTALTIEDIGPRVDNRRDYGFTTFEPTVNQTVEKAKSTSEYEKTFAAAWYQSYLPGGGQNTIAGSRMYHGDVGSTGILKSMVGFSSAIQSFIGDGTVTGVEIILPNTHTYSASGMTVRVGWHGASAKPTTFQEVYSHSSTYGKQAAVARGATVRIPASIIGPFLKSGSIRGITLDPKTSGLAYYGHFDGPGVQIKIKVEK